MCIFHGERNTCHDRLNAVLSLNLRVVLMVMIRCSVLSGLLGLDFPPEHQPSPEELHTPATTVSLSAYLCFSYCNILSQSYFVALIVLIDV